MPTLDESASGVFIISVTPFTDDGDLDLDSTDRLVDFYLERGVSGITILGMMGEAPKLTLEEAITFVARVARRVDGRIPIVVGASNPGLIPMQHLVQRVMDLGAAGVMVAPTPGLKTDDAVFNYYELVCETIKDTPLVVQDYPQSTGVSMAVSLLRRMVAAFPQFKVLKHEDCPGLAKLSALRETGDSRRVSILVGNGGLYYPQELARGADGAMTGFAYPEMLVQIHRKFMAGDTEGAEDLFDAYLPYVRHEQQPGFGLALRKQTLYQRGAIASPRVRAPGPRLSALDLQELQRMLARLERRLADLVG